MSQLHSRLRGHSYPAQKINPLTAIGWKAAFWADDPLWSNPGNGVAVSSWRDGSTTGLYTLTQGTVANRPTFRTGVTNLNGQSAVHFDGSNDSLGITTPVFTQPHSTVLVLDIVSLGAADTGVSDSNGSGAGIVFWLNSNKKWTFYSGGSGGVAISLTSPLAATGLNAVRATFNGASSSMSNNGTSTGTVNLGNNPSYTGITLGAARGPSSYASVRIGFAGFYPGDITADPAWGAVKSILSTLYGATLA